MGCKSTYLSSAFLLEMIVNCSVVSVRLTILFFVSGTCHTANWSSMLVFISIWCYHNLENEFRQLCLLLQKRPWCHRAVEEYITSFSLAQGEEGPGCYRAALIVDVFRFSFSWMPVNTLESTSADWASAVRKGEENWVNGVHNVYYLAKVLYAQSQIFFKPECWKCLTKTCVRPLKQIHWCMKLPSWPGFLERKRKEDQVR